jgi:phage terminase Nu1 subunit (DNA packaging protein)
MGWHNFCMGTIADLPDEASIGEMAALLDCTLRTVSNLAARGVVIRIRHGRYNAPQSITNYVRHLRELAAARGSDDAAAVKANADFKDARTRLLEARLKREAAELIDRDELIAGWRVIKAGTERMINGLPAKIGAAVPALTETDQRTIRQLVSDNLTDLALDRGFDIGRAVVDDDEDELPPAA